jgi:acyl-CoA reductase-like NAD-dependent aldehyde dehydrogenase
MEKKTYKQTWYAKNREKAIEYTKKWQKENKEKVNKKNKKWYDNNKEKASKSTLHWRKKYPEKHKVYIKKWNETVVRRRREFRNKLKEEMGNKCSKCGYNEIPEILHFHHLKDKEFNIGSYRSYSLEKIREEAKKCVLLCPNCHAIETLKNNFEKV